MQERRQEEFEIVCHIIVKRIIHEMSRARICSKTVDEERVHIAKVNGTLDKTSAPAKNQSRRVGSPNRNRVFLVKSIEVERTL